MDSIPNIWNPFADSEHLLCQLQDHRFRSIQKLEHRQDFENSNPHPRFSWYCIDV